MTGDRGFRGSEQGGLEVPRLVGREDLVRSCGVPLALYSRRKLVPEDVVRKVSFRCRGDGVGGEVQEEHPVSMHVFDCYHVFGHLGEEGEVGLLVSFEGVTVMPRITCDAVYSGSDLFSIVVTVIS